MLGRCRPQLDSCDSLLRDAYASAERQMRRRERRQDRHVAVAAGGLAIWLKEGAGESLGGECEGGLCPGEWCVDGAVSSVDDDVDGGGFALLEL